MSDIGTWDNITIWDKIGDITHAVLGIGLGMMSIALGICALCAAVYVTVETIKYFRKKTDDV